MSLIVHNIFCLMILGRNLISTTIKIQFGLALDNRAAERRNHLGEKCVSCTKVSANGIVSRCSGISCARQKKRNHQHGALSLFCRRRWLRFAVWAHLRRSFSGVSFFVLRKQFIWKRAAESSTTDCERKRCSQKVSRSQRHTSAPSCQSFSQHKQRKRGSEWRPRDLLAGDLWPHDACYFT